MEELYKPTEAEKVELYNRENSDMLGDTPDWLIHTGSYIVYLIIGVLIVGTALFSYPDVVHTTITVNDMANVEWITANRPGKIDRFFVENESWVKRNDTLGVLKNAAAIEDVTRFCQVLTNVEKYYRTNDFNYLRNYPFDLIMGDMTGAYEQFTQAVRTSFIYHEFDLYPQRKKYLTEELALLEKSEEKNELALLKVRRELFDLEVEHKMELAKNRKLLELAYENMVNNLKIWDSNYLIKSNSDGMVVWGKSWSMSNTVQEGDTLCSILSGQKGELVGHITLSQGEVAGVSPGNKVNIELNKYPAHSYGYILGEVSSVSYVPSNKSYAIEVTFPDALHTTAKKEISYELGLGGKAEVITSSRSVLKRIFAPLQQMFN